MPPDAAHDPDIRRFEEQYAENPDSFVFARLADAYRKSGRTGRALALLEDGLSRHPEYLSARIVLARTLRDMGRTEEAAAAFGRVLELDGRNLVAIRALAEIARRRPELEAIGVARARLRELGAPGEEAREILEEALAGSAAAAPREDGGNGGDGTDAPAEDAPCDEGGGLATVTLAELHLAQGLHEEAVRIYERLLRRRPEDPELRRGLERARRLRDGEPPDPPEPPADATPADATGADGTAGDGRPADGAAGGERTADDRAAAGGRGDGERADGAEPPPELSIREYLARLLEGTAPSPGTPDDPVRAEGP